MKHLMLLPALAFAATLSAQTAAPGTVPSSPKAGKKTTHTAAKRKTAARPTVNTQIEELRKAMEAQQQQIDTLRQQVAQRDQQLQQVQSQAAQSQQAVTAAQQAQSSADQANQKAEQVAESVKSVNQDVQTVKDNAVATNQTIQEEQKRIGSLESPLAIHYKGVTITPGGFIEAASVYRQHAIGADINTPFNQIPYPGADSYHTSEFFGTGRQSRVSLLVEGKVGRVKASGYYEADWLGAGITSNNNQSNSYVLRQRQLFAQAALDSGWTFTAGQQWSLATETRSMMNNRTEVLPQTIDPQYMVGFNWARQFGFRVVRNLGKKYAIAASVENAQALLTAHGNLANFDIGGPGNGGGLYNSTANYSFNPSPDFIFKFVGEPGFGHFEVFGIVRDFRDRIYPNVTSVAATSSAAGAFNSSTQSAGWGAHLRIPFAKKRLEYGLSYLGGDGMGRYGSSTLPDTTVQPNGRLSLLNSQQVLTGFELHNQHWDVGAYAGGEYAGRRAFLNGTAGEGYGSPLFNNSGCFTETLPTAATGFAPGSPANCTADTRSIFEGTLSGWYKFFNGPKGRLQVGAQYSYYTKNAWTGVGGAPHTVENVVETALRYYLP
jgi:hypothetical protein